MLEYVRNVEELFEETEEVDTTETVETNEDCVSYETDIYDIGLVVALTLAFVFIVAHISGIGKTKLKLSKSGIEFELDNVDKTK